VAGIQNGSLPAETQKCYYEPVYCHKTWNKGTSADMRGWCGPLGKVRIKKSEHQKFLHISDSQPEVHIPPGLQNRTLKSVQKNIINGGKRHIHQQCNTATTYKPEIPTAILITNILLIWKLQFMKMGCQGVCKWKNVGNHCSTWNKSNVESLARKKEET